MRLVGIFIVLAVGAFLFNACQSSWLVLGIYSIENTEHNNYKLPVEHKLQLDDDSTFNYIFQGGFHKEVSSGRWLQGPNKNEIHLVSSFPNIHSIPITVAESICDDTTTTFILSDPIDEYIDWTLKVNGTDYSFQNDVVQLDERIVVKEIVLEGYLRQPVSTSSIIPYPIWDSIGSTRYHVTDPKSNLFSISFSQPIDFSIYYYVPIDEMVKINRHSLWFKGNRFKKLLE